MPSRFTTAGHADVHVVGAVLAVEQRRDGEDGVLVADDRLREAQQAHADRVVGRALALDDVVRRVAHVDEDLLEVLAGSSAGRARAISQTGMPLMSAWLHTGSSVSPCSPMMFACTLRASTSKYSPSRKRKRAVSRIVPEPMTRCGGQARALPASRTTARRPGCVATTRMPPKPLRHDLAADVAEDRRRCA